MHLKHLLNKYKLKSTPCRLEVLTFLIENERALSHADIEQLIGPSIDRVTVYRTLRTFLDKGLIHKVLDDVGATKYAICHDCSENIHNHEHVHFKCEDCGQTKCLDDIKIPDVEMPDGFHSKQKNLLIQGICAACK